LLLLFAVPVLLPQGLQRGRKIVGKSAGKLHFLTCSGMTKTERLGMEAETLGTRLANGSVVVVSHNWVSERGKMGSDLMSYASGNGDANKRMCGQNCQRNVSC
jgi:hypothetical protein